ncbi:hypothetical protein SAMN04487928_10747 [Butyrivibrio proteoclasticus]|uniref:Uncharacterized protein n=1 Tax=Butyrivibrio proteoclasticus TaxID=43305 RepID=A0A1I5SSX0_9FIRM|nr:hypothetical protein [Butyrivibrio proteoclasticus]SFP73872.1 hypothetical protein SAMN04487928_10747 [Butyrivibrio proteoclasticus]
MKFSKKNENLIHDSGIIKDKRFYKSKIFVGLCQLFSVILIILGILAIFAK